MNLRVQARELANSLKGYFGPSAYDTAWMARVPANDGQGAQWPDLIDWLVENQWLDGSWGGGIAYYHDRIISTLATIIALKEQGEGPLVQEAIERGERYIWHNLHRLRHDPFELVGFELILPTLLIDALDLGLDVPKHTCGYGRIRREKLKLIPPELIYSPGVTVVHSMEFLGKEVNVDQMRQALAPNGSLGNSPAATSYYLLKAGHDPRSIDYLDDMLGKYQHAVCLYPSYSFELAWVLHALSFCNEPLDKLVDDHVWKKLQSYLTEQGTGLDPTFGIEDGDCTSVTMWLLTREGYPVDPTILKKFEEETRIFRTYDFERNLSVGTNVHILEALSLLPDYPNVEVIKDSVVSFLLANRTFDTYWVDKWHASPYYATAHVLIGISRSNPDALEACHRSVDWLTHTQREDGSWGFFHRGTAEETAYALTALTHCSKYFSIDADLLHRGTAFLYREMLSEPEEHSPPLWLGKPLYVPHGIVRATILSALILYEETFGAL